MKRKAVRVKVEMFAGTANEILRPFEPGSCDEGVNGT